MATLKQIKGKMETIKNVKKITKTMEAVSASKMKKAINAALETREYTVLGLELLKNLSKEKYLKNKLLNQNNSEQTLVILISSNKGLCGSFNMTVARSVWQVLKKYAISKVSFVAVGKYAEKFIRKTDSSLLATFIDELDDSDPEKIKAISSLVLDEFKEGRVGRVIVMYANFVSALSYKLVARTILPVTEEIVENMLEDTGEGFEAEDTGKPGPYLFEPSDSEVLDYVLEKLVDIMVYQAILESLASEHSARRVAMKSATDNAGKLFDELQLGYNRARQAAITQEISEISAGAEAVTS